MNPRTRRLRRIRRRNRLRECSWCKVRPGTPEAKEDCIQHVKTQSGKYALMGPLSAQHHFVRRS